MLKVLTDPEVLTELGGRIRGYRLQQNLSIASLAMRAGIAPLTLQNAEHGQNFTVETLIRLLRALGRLEQLDALLPEPGLSPLALLAERRRAQHPRRRARRTSGGG
jgi:transcriptional regulator with XRE-family HTH domain